MQIDLKKALLDEYNFEAENTIKLLSAVSNSILDYKPNDFNWTIGQLCTHIAETYYWWQSTLNQDVLEMTEYSYDKGDTSNIENIIQKCEENIDATRKILQDYPVEKLFETWRMTNNGVDLFPPAKRIGVIRNYLISHLIHHRGEVIAYLRVNHQRVPGLYGPSYEESAVNNPDIED